MIILQQDGKEITKPFEGQIDCKRVAVFKVGEDYVANIVTEIPKNTYQFTQTKVEDFDKWLNFRFGIEIPEK